MLTERDTDERDLLILRLAADGLDDHAIARMSRASVVTVRRVLAADRIAFPHEPVRAQ